MGVTYLSQAQQRPSLATILGHLPSQFDSVSPLLNCCVQVLLTCKTIWEIRQTESMDRIPCKNISHQENVLISIKQMRRPVV